MRYVENKHDPCKRSRYTVLMPVTAAVYALAKGNLEVLSWLEDQGAIAHKELNATQAKMLLDLNENGIPIINDIFAASLTKTECKVTYQPIFLTLMHNINSTLIFRLNGQQKGMKMVPIRFITENYL